MISDFLSQKEFSVSFFLNELDKKELMFLDFLSNLEKEEDIQEVCNYIEDINNFYDEVEDMVDANADVDVKKLSKETLINILTQRYEDLNFSSIVYKSIYYYHSKLEKPLFNTKLLAIDQTASFIFFKNIHTISERFLLNDIKKQGYSLEYLKKNFCLFNRPVLNTLGLVILIGKIDSQKEKISKEVQPHLMEFKECLLYLLFHQFEEVQKKQVEELQQMNKKQSIELIKAKEELRKKEEMVLKLKDITKKLSMEVKNLKKNIVSLEEKEKQKSNSEILKQLYNDLRRKDQQIEQLTKDLKKLKEKPLNLYQTLIDDLNNQILMLKSQNREKLYELREWKKNQKTL